LSEFDIPQKQSGIGNKKALGDPIINPPIGISD
jgi:hypothetical protein